MEIIKINERKKRYLPLLLLGDEQESMIDRYLEAGELYVLREGESALAVCVVTRPAPDTAEIKNLAVDPRFQRRGLGRRMVDFVAAAYAERCSRLLVGTGDSPLTVPFYRSCGFRESHRVANFFTDHYDHPIFEAGRQLVDLVYFQMELPRETEVPIPLDVEPAQKGKNSMTKREQLCALRNDPNVHYNCAQSMLIPFAGETGIPAERANAIALNFGGGMGCSSACGAFTGTLMAMGALGLPQERREDFAAWFRARQGSLDCDGILKGVPRHTPEQKAICDELLEACMDWLCREAGLE